MAYKKQNFTAGSILKAEELNKIEDAIVTGENSLNATISDLNSFKSIANTNKSDLNTVKTNLSSLSATVAANANDIAYLKENGGGGGDKSDYAVNTPGQEGYVANRPMYYTQETFPDTPWNGSAASADVNIEMAEMGCSFYRLSAELHDEDDVKGGMVTAMVRGVNYTNIPIAIVARTYSEIMISLMTVSSWASDYDYVAAFVPGYFIGFGEDAPLVLCVIPTSTSGEDTSDVIPIGAFIRNSAEAGMPNGFYAIKYDESTYIKQISFEAVVVHENYKAFFNKMAPRIRSLNVSTETDAALIDAAMNFLNFKNGDIILLTGDALSELGG